MADAGLGALSPPSNFRLGVHDLTRQPDPGAWCLLPPAAAPRGGLPRVVCAGRACWTGVLVPAVGEAAGEPVTLVVAREGLAALGLPPDLTVRVEACGPVLRLGPVVALVVATRNSRITRRALDHVRRHLEALPAGLGYCCALDAARPRAGRWLGYRLTAGGDWERGLFPAPDVVYLRIAPTARQHAAVARRVGIRRLFNSTVWVDKWACHRRLAGEPLAAPFLPETALLTPGSLEALLERHGFVYVKPLALDLGRGVARVERMAGGGYRVRYRRDDAEHGEDLRNYAALTALLSRLAPGQRYLVQQGIRLLRLGDRPFDFRYMVQRTGAGGWEVTAATARVAAPDAVVTHITHGAEPRPPEEALAAALGDQSLGKRLAGELAGTAIAVARALDRGYGHLADVGLDLAVDVDGRIWLLEVNGGPDHTIFSHDPDAFRRVSAAPMAYATWLAGFAPAAGAQDTPQPVLA